jgi:hypothetical protein
VVKYVLTNCFGVDLSRFCITYKTCIQKQLDCLKKYIKNSFPSCLNILDKIQGHWKNSTFFKIVHTVHFLDRVSLFTNKIHYFNENIIIILQPDMFQQSCAIFRRCIKPRHFYKPQHQVDSPYNYVAVIKCS